jgi:hypothetical protein
VPRDVRRPKRDWLFVAINKKLVQPIEKVDVTASKPRPADVMSASDDVARCSAKFRPQELCNFGFKRYTASFAVLRLAEFLGVLNGAVNDDYAIVKVKLFHAHTAHFARANAAVQHDEHGNTEMFVGFCKVDDGSRLVFRERLFFGLCLPDNLGTANWISVG